MFRELGTHATSRFERVEALQRHAASAGCSNTAACRFEDSGMPSITAACRFDDSGMPLQCDDP